MFNLFPTHEAAGVVESAKGDKKIVILPRQDPCQFQRAVFNFGTSLQKIAQIMILI